MAMPSRWPACTRAWTCDGISDGARLVARADLQRRPVPRLLGSGRALAVAGGAWGTGRQSARIPHPVFGGLGAGGAVADLVRDAGAPPFALAGRDPVSPHARPVRVLLHRPARA